MMKPELGVGSEVEESCHQSPGFVGELQAYSLRPHQHLSISQWKNKHTGLNDLGLFLKINTEQSLK